MIESEFFFAEVVFDPQIVDEGLPIAVAALHAVCNEGGLDRWPIFSKDNSDCLSGYALVGTLEVLEAATNCLTEEGLILSINPEDFMPTIGPYLPEQLDDKGLISDLPQAI